MAIDNGKMPARLGRAGRTLWHSIADVYELRADEIRILEDACREADLIERLNDELADAPLVTTGSMGQEVASPFVSELRQHRAALSSLLRQLKLPDTARTALADNRFRQDRAGKGAAARWRGKAQ